MKRFRQLFSDHLSAATALSARGRIATGSVGGLLILFLLAPTLGGTTLGTRLMDRVHDAAYSLGAVIGTDTTSWNAPSLPPTPILRNLPAHPANELAPYLTPNAQSSAVPNPHVLDEFHDLLAQFTRRQTADDNFTVRVIDRRTNETLELYEFTKQRRAFQRGAVIDWQTLDDHRRTVTRRLVDKYEHRGVPLDDIIVRWGRANQIEEAQKRARPYQAYEIQLAQHLGLSLLSTQIGTVETFHQDDLVSSVGAKSRYQMMPWILRRSGVNAYDLQSEAGTRVPVEEALHPLLTMEPAFLLLRGYVNAVGHEIPGLSAYHAGPGNIYTIYRRYVTDSGYYESTSTVADAYIWAATEGFDTISAETTFGGFSRGYVPSAYGALNAQDQRPVDLSQTLRTARVQLKPDTTLSLRSLVTVLDTTARAFDWGPASTEPTTYARFRALNEHMGLPASEDGALPPAANVTLPSTVDGKAVRFFLPIAAPDALRRAGLDVLAPDRTFRFDESTYPPPSTAQRTVWDERYDALVDDIEHFGFTPEHRERLLSLSEKFEELAAETPSRYRRRQLDIIRTHRRIWMSDPWDKLSALAVHATGQRTAPIHSPTEAPDQTDLREDVQNTARSDGGGAHP